MATKPFTAVEDLFNELARGFLVRPLATATGALQVKLDVRESDAAYNVFVEIPGVRKEDIRLDVEGGRVRVSAEVKSEEATGERVLYNERTYGRVGREFDLPGDVDSAGVHARYENGVLRLTLPKKSRSGRRVDIA